MSQLAFHAPETIDQALALLAGDPGARVLAGGTDLIVQMRSGRVAPSAVIDLKRIAGLGGVRALPGGGFAIGAATPCTALKAAKLANLNAHQPAAIYTANIGCWMHLSSDSTAPVRHWLEAVDEVTRP